MNKQQALKKLGQHIKKVRKEKNLSQTELAYSINKDQQSIQRLEAGKINPSYIYLREIAEGLEISLNDLLNF